MLTNTFIRWSGIRSKLQFINDRFEILKTNSGQKTHYFGSFKSPFYLALVLTGTSAMTLACMNENDDLITKNSLWLLNYQLLSKSMSSKPSVNNPTSMIFYSKFLQHGPPWTKSVLYGP